MDYKNNKLNSLTEIKSIQNIIIVHITRHATDVTVCNRDLPASERSPFRLQKVTFCVAICHLSEGKRYRFETVRESRRKISDCKLM